MSENQLGFSRIWLIGLSGSGKTTVGEMLAQQLHASFIDTDALISSREKTTISEIFKTKGESYFRLLEKEVSEQLVASPSNGLTIISTGGGFPCFHENGHKMFLDGLVVYLKCPTAIIAERLSEANDRPLLQTESMCKQLDKQLETRKAEYEQAHLVLDASKSPDEITSAIIDLLKALQTDTSFDYQSNEVQTFLKTIEIKKEAQATAISLYHAVRDGFLYDPYHLDISEMGLKASKVATKKRAWCVEKALLMAACARSLKIPARLGFAIVSNHIGTEKLTHYLRRQEIVFHGFAVLFIKGKWVKCTPAFDKRVCALSKVEPLEWDGENDSLFQDYSQGKQFMEYLHNYGEFDAIPFELMKKEMKEYYPHLFAEKYDSKDFSFRY